MTPKQLYKIESSNYRYRVSEVRKALLAYEHRAPNADLVREVDHLSLRLQDIPNYPKPEGFDRPALVMNDGRDGWSYHLTMSRKRTAENIRNARVAIQSRAKDAVEAKAGGWDVPIYSVSTDVLAKALASYPDSHLKYVKGGRA